MNLLFVFVFSFFFFGKSNISLAYDVDDNIKYEFTEYKESKRNVFVSLVNKNKRAVVSIMCYNLNHDYNNNHFFYNGDENVSWGSGFLITDDGYILTNNHVVDNNKKIIVKYGKNEYNAQLIGQDHLRDIAIIKINSDEKFDYINIDDFGKETEIGEDIIVMGNPLNYGFSVSHGIISAFGRTVKSLSVVRTIQLDAAVEEGNSGGPVFDVNGKIIGIASFKGGTNITFAIPIDTNLISIIRNLIDFGYNQNGYIGVNGITSNNFGEGYSTNFSSVFGYNNVENGVLVTEIEKDSPAEKAGLLVSDIVVYCDGKKINGVEEFANIISNTMISSNLELIVLRNEKRIKLKVKVVENPYFTKYYQITEKIRSNSIEVADMLLSGIDDNLIERYNLNNVRKNEGMYVLDVKPNGLASSMNIQAGDILLTLNQTQVKSKEDIVKFINVLRSKKQKSKDITSVLAILKKANTGRSDIIFVNPNYFIY